MMSLINKLILDKNILLNTFVSKLDKNETFLLTYFNAHCFNYYFESQKYKTLLDNFFTVYTDGVGVWLLMKRLNKKYKRFNATDVNKDLMNILKEKKRSFILIGGNFDEKLIYQKAQKLGLIIEKYINGYLEEGKIVESIDKCVSNIFFIGMGVPQQEKLAYKIAEKYPSVKVICVGNFFNYYFGFQKRAPKLFQNLYLEWFYRLLSEPRRLIKRYTIGNFKFIIRALSIKDESK
ncbi:MAG: WecB/TagA/CpsF family glycosyltransferase [Ignavibacteria bacterium]|nr:WecB/TagA/CpsF family glycosyltransferase [Ignavibacteria bacterium]